MPLLQWNDELSVGINSIDEQHKTLVDMINTLNDALQAGKADDILAEIFDGLTAYAENHCGYEETLFAEYGYQETESHKKEHKVLIQQIEDLKNKMEGGDFMISVEVMVFLKDWLVNHIMKTDKAYAPFLKEKGVE